VTVNVTLNNGVQMPALGFGVFQTPPDVTAQAVGTALATGYRLIDTAAAYGNEREAGQAIRHSGLARDDVFIETKIWISDYGYDQTLHAFDKSAGKLGVDRIDLLILHQALPARFGLTQEAYRALETLLADGRVRAIGVSNFMPGHLDVLLTQATVIPRSTRSRCTRTSPSRPCRPPTPLAASSPRRGRRSAASPATAVPGPPPSTTQPSTRSPPPTARPRRR
jgi:diketogulonate reductase-like aldo/keto reductase